MGKVLYSCCDFSHFLGALSTPMSAGGVYMSDANCNSRYEILVRLLVTNQLWNVFEAEIVVIL